MSSSIRHRNLSRRIEAEESDPLPKISQLVRTISWDDLPEWLQDNHYIVSGYRRVQSDWLECFRSLYAYLHNETVNIHSHLWGGVFFLYLLSTTELALLTTGSTTLWDSVMFSIFLGAATTCMFCSAISHLTACHSQEVCTLCHDLDFAGIVILELGTHYTLLYYGFFCEPVYQALYMTAVTIIDLAALYAVLSPEYKKPTHIGLRTAMFMSPPFCSVIPLCHWVFLYGFETTFVGMGARWGALSGCFYVGGSLLFANRIPERFFPGKFDYFFASHQIFHFCAVIGAYLHFAFISVALDYGHTKSVCSSLHNVTD